MLKEKFMTNPKTKIAALLAKNELKGLKNQLDYSEYGGAGLFGLKAPVIKAHGSSNQQAIFSAIQQAITIVETDVVKKIQTEVNMLPSSSHGEES